jgi:uncharacterized SAM-binding protein YcdF (DUF218 family)
VDNASDIEQLCSDINCIAAYLALDDFIRAEPEARESIDAIVLMGNQVMATLPAAFLLARKFPQALLLISGGVGHSTGALYENLRGSAYGHLFADGAILETMAEAEMIAVVAQRAFAIPESRLLIEKQSTQCGENARFSLQVLKAALGRPATAVILQDPTMQRRAVVTWEREAEIAAVPVRALAHAAFVPRVEPGPGGLPRLVRSEGTWTFERFLALILGEIRRLHDDEDGYGPRGRNFLPHVDIPSTAFESYRRVSASRLNALAVR